MEKELIYRKTARRLKLTKFSDFKGKLGKLKKTWENLNCKMLEYQQLTGSSSFPSFPKQKVNDIKLLEYVTYKFSPNPILISIGVISTPILKISGFGSEQNFE